MANRRTHSLTGAVAGGVSALYLARGEEPLHRILESVGGFVGGVAGGRLPDLLEPALTPRHRGVAHSVALAGVAVAVFAPRVRRAQRRIREWGDRRRSPCDAGAGTLQPILGLLAEMACRLLTGAAAGVAAGYVSHLVLDAGTPVGLPLLR